jgi:hypothetical protein
VQNYLILEAGPSLWNRTSGLCGRLNGRMETDFSTPTADQEQKIDGGESM